MKKSLIAAAALSAIAGAAQAQSSVAVYGVIDMSVQSVNVDTNPGRNYAAGADGSVATSRLGFRGTEDLGNGNSVQFNLEGCLNGMSTGAMGAGNGTAGGASKIFNRESNIQINNKQFGSLRLGTTDVTDAGNIEIIVSRIGVSGLNGVTDIDLDLQQVASYRSPTIGGFRFQYGFSNNAQTSGVTDISTGNVTSMFGAYTKGPLELYVGAAERKADAVAQNVKQKHYGLRYNAGFVDFGAYYGTVDGVSANANAATTGVYSYTLGGVNNGGTAKLTTQRYTASIPVKALGQGVAVGLLYGKDETKTAIETDSELRQVGLSKAFSKRTTGYVSYRTQDYKLNTAADRKTDLAQKPEVYGLIKECVEKVNADLAEDSLLAGSQVSRFLVLHKELDADDGELTRTNKVRRGFIAEKYEPLIQALYGGLYEQFIETQVKFEDGRTGSVSATLKISDATTFTPVGKAA